MKLDGKQHHSGPTTQYPAVYVHLSFLLSVFMNVWVLIRNRESWLETIIIAEKIGGNVSVRYAVVRE